MRKRLLINRKQGFTFLEVIISVLIIGFISISFYYSLSLYKKNIIKVKKAYEKEKIVTTTYQTLSLSPYLFKERMCYTFDGLWEKGSVDGALNTLDTFIMSNYDYTISHYEDYALIRVEIYEGEQLIQSWIRAKTGMY